ncbi:uncharacterized protein LOC113294813 [Papaver somniferum]|uniref:uncharacterized protein LOC113294813 n=1 Tax=Papaver somniferum TaxID=3469 RepID=UPI000E700EA4|nr:uncharacterized protein LOC113294813 [Papaver somniferum]
MPEVQQTEQLMEVQHAEVRISDTQQDKMQAEEDGFSSPTKTARRNAQDSITDPLETSNMFETGTEEVEEEVENIFTEDELFPTALSTGIVEIETAKGGRTIKEIYVNEFRSWISDNGLVEADAIGKKYTWSNCRSGNERIVSKHDRAVVNDAWLYKYENWRCKALPRICSDHSPLFGLKEALKVWNRTVFGEIQFRLKQAGLKLESESDLLDLDPGVELQFVKISDAKKAVEDVRTELAVMLKMKSCITWLEDGDQNTRFFHNSIRMRRSQNTISELKISYNSTLFLQDEIKDYIVDHYHAKFNGGEVNTDPRLFDIDHESISATESASMDAIPPLEENKEAAFDLGADSAPGPDGFSGSFYRHCWNIISKDIYNAIANCWSMRKFPMA